MKKLIAVLLIAALAAGMFGCSSDSKDNSSDGSSSQTQGEPEEKYDFFDEFAPGVECKTVDSDVYLTVPQDYIDALGFDTMEGMNEENGYKDVIKNEDGTTTLVLTQELHGNIVEAMGLSLKFTVTQMDMSDEYPNFTSIVVNDDFTRFDITTSQESLSEEETMTTLDFLKISATYNSIAGNEVESCKVVYTSDVTGQVIYEFDTADL